VLSGYSDTSMVFKGVTHGACDYLVKPVRLEELRNIWQHVVRKKKTYSKDDNKASNEDKVPNISEGSNQNILENSADQNKRLGKRRKEQDEEEKVEEDEESEGSEDGDEDDPSSQKKPRVVWSPELHKKFVCAVNQLGADSKFSDETLSFCLSSMLYNFICKHGYNNS